MPRINKNTFEHPAWWPAMHERSIDTPDPEMEGYVLIGELVRDVELGMRASEKLDCWEDETDITWYADLAIVAALEKMT